MKDDEKIKITWDDVNQVSLPPSSSSQRPPTERRYGTITVGAPSDQGGKGPLWMQAWFYLGMGGLLGAFLGWAICEPWFSEDPLKPGWGNHLLMILVVILMSTGYAVLESLVEQSLRKLLVRVGLTIVVGTGLAFLFQTAANHVFTAMLQAVQQSSSRAGEPLSFGPGIVMARSIGWTVFGAVGGVVYGMIGTSVRKGLYGVIGGVIGAGVGGALFDPICTLSQIGGPSRAIACSIFGCLTGVSMGLVESAMKERWLYVISGPLAGKQFVLYKQETLIGRDPAADIYLFKDSSILPEHAALTTDGRHTRLLCVGEVSVNGSRVQNANLRDGDRFQIGRFVFEYREPRRAG